MTDRANSFITKVNSKHLLGETWNLCKVGKIPTQGLQINKGDRSVIET